jgi:hypothetical protein
MITRGFFEEKKILAAYPIASKDFFLKKRTPRCRQSSCDRCHTGWL